MSSEQNSQADQTNQTDAEQSWADAEEVLAELRSPERLAEHERRTNARQLALEAFLAGMTRDLDIDGERTQDRAAVLDVLSSPGIGTYYAMRDAFGKREAADLDRVVYLDAYMLEGSLGHVPNTPIMRALRDATVIVIDESDRTTRQVDENIGRLIAERSISGRPLPELELVVLIRNTGDAAIEPGSLPKLGSSVSQFSMRL